MLTNFLLDEIFQTFSLLTPDTILLMKPVRMIISQKLCGGSQYSPICPWLNRVKEQPLVCVGI